MEASSRPKPLCRTAEITPPAMISSAICSLPAQTPQPVEISKLTKTDRGASSNSCMIHAMLGRNFNRPTAQNLRDAISTKLMDWLIFTKDLDEYPENERESVTLCRGYYLQMLCKIMPMMKLSGNDMRNTAEFADLRKACRQCGNTTGVNPIDDLSRKIEVSQDAVSIKRLIERLEDPGQISKADRTTLSKALLLATKVIQKFNQNCQPELPFIQNQLRNEEDPKAERIGFANELNDLLDRSLDYSEADSNLIKSLQNNNLVNNICTTMIGLGGNGKFLHATFAPLIHLAVNKVLHDDMQQDGDCSFNSIYDRKESDTREEGVAWLHDMREGYNVTHLPTLVIYSPGSGHNAYDRTTCFLGKTEQVDNGSEPPETQEEGVKGNVESLFSQVGNVIHLLPYSDKAHHISQRRFNATSQPEVRRLYINGNGGAHYYQLTQEPGPIGDHNLLKIASPPPRQGSGCCKYIIASITTFAVALLAHKHIALISMKLGVSIATLSILIYVIPVIIAVGLCLHYRKKNQVPSIAATASSTTPNNTPPRLEAAVHPKVSDRSSQPSPSESPDPPRLEAAEPAQSSDRSPQPRPSESIDPPMLTNVPRLPKEDLIKPEATRPPGVLK